MLQAGENLAFWVCRRHPLMVFNATSVKTIAGYQLRDGAIAVRGEMKRGI
jgi:hypothetical protein